MKSAAELVAEAKAGGSCLDAEQSAAQLKNSDVLLLDIREPAECANGMIDGAVNLPRGLLEFRIAEVCEDKEKEILIHCAGGGRAALASDSLKSMGYTNVHIVDAMFPDLFAACSAS